MTAWLRFIRSIQPSSKRQAMPLGKAHELTLIRERDGIWGEHHERLRVRIDDRRKAAGNVVGATHLDRLELHAHRTGRLLELLALEQGTANVQIPDHCHSGELGNSLPQQLEPLRAGLRRHPAHAGDVGPGPSQAGDESRPDRVRGGHHHDRDGLSLSLDGGDRGIGRGHDHVHARPHQLGRYLVDPVAAATSIPALHNDASSFHVPTLAEALCERLVELCGRGRRARKKNADARNFGRLLPSGTTRRQHAGDDRDEDDEGRAPHGQVSSAQSGVASMAPRSSPVVERPGAERPALTCEMPRSGFMPARSSGMLDVGRRGCRAVGGTSRLLSDGGAPCYGEPRPVKVLTRISVG